MLTRRRERHAGSIPAASIRHLAARADPADKRGRGLHCRPTSPMSLIVEFVVGHIARGF